MSAHGEKKPIRHMIVTTKHDANSLIYKTR